MMQTELRSFNDEISKPSKINSDKRKIVFAAPVCVVLLVLSLFFQIFSVVCFLFVAILLLISSDTVVIAIMLFLIPFASVFKWEPGSVAFFTMLELIVAVLLFVRHKQISGWLAVAMLLFSAQTLIYQDTSLLSLIKILCRLYIIYVFVQTYKPKDALLYVWTFGSALIVSTVISLWKEELPRFRMLYTDLNYEKISGQMLSRFSGMYQDPNDYSVAVCMGILLLIVLALGNKQNRSERIISIVAILTLMVFGLSTLSKSFLFMMVYLVVVWLFSSRQNGKLKILFFGVLAAVIVFAIDPWDIVSRLSLRFANFDLTTGRVNIWRKYIYAISESVPAFLFGHGIDSNLTKVAHNVALELLYSVGAIGLLLWLSAVYFAAYNGKHAKKSWINYTAFLVVIVMYQFLSGFRSLEIYYHIILATIVFRCDRESKAIYPDPTALPTQ